MFGRNKRDKPKPKPKPKHPTMATTSNQSNKYTNTAMPGNAIEVDQVKSGGVTLLIIDPQNDFHPGEENTLSVPHADDDTERVVSLIRESISSSSSLTINRIVVTLDSHHKFHIANPGFWVDANGAHPPPFTSIRCSDVESGIWRPRADLKLPIGPDLLDLDILAASTSTTASLTGTRKHGENKVTYNKKADGSTSLDILAYCIEYTRALEKSGKFTLVIWPEHCIIGTKGHCVVDTLNHALSEWNAATGTSIEYVHKGQNILTEMYSALRAEVPISKETQLNRQLFNSLNQSDRIIVCGQALSHCVNYTVRDLMNNMNREEKKKVILLEDCSSTVPYFEKDADNFLQFVKDGGGTVMKGEQCSRLMKH
jgi:nicotinamidase/pyrazinamidase